MRAERSALKNVIDSVADGSADIDWERLEQQGHSERDLALFRQLRVVAQVSNLQRAEIAEIEQVDEGPLLASAEAMARIRTRSMTARADVVESRVANRGDNAPMLPTRYWGRLELFERLGEGAFGEVYRAFDPQLERDVAVKLLHVGKRSTQKRVLDEARALARVRHPNVVIVHDAETHDGRVGLCMEFIRGQTLASLLKAHGKLGPTEATSIALALCRALAAVHNEGLLHRDIKAQNVMREEGGRIVLMDFGAGQRRDVAGQGPARLTGTPLYLAPEILEGGHATVRSDLYSLGVLLYHLVTTDYPVQGKSLDELKAAHRDGRRVRLHDARPDLPDPFVRVVERAIDADPSRRYQSAGELGEALGATDIVLPSRPLHGNGWRLALVGAAVAVSVTAVSMGPLREWLATPSDTRPVIVVLPLDRGPDVEEYLAADVTDALNQALSVVDGAIVVSRTSVKAAQRADASLPQMAQALGAQFVLEGRLTRTGDVMTASLNLVEAPRDHTVLARKFQFTLPAIERLQRDVLLAITEHLKVPVEVADRAGLGGTVRGDARELYARGRFALSKYTGAGRTEAIDYFKRAIAADPRFALAHAALAEAYVRTAQPNVMQPSYELAERAAQEALTLDPLLADAHAVLADIRMIKDWNWAIADAEFQKAIALAPSLTAGYRYSMLLAARGQTDQALEYILHERRLDPLASGVAVSVSTILQYQGRFAEALDAVEKAELLEPKNPVPPQVKGRVLTALGRYRDARTAFLRAGELGAVGGSDYIRAELAALDAAEGRREAAQQALVALEERAASGQLDPTMVAFVHGRLGHLDEAFGWLERAYAERSVRLVWIKVDPRFRPLSGDQRYSALVERMGLD
jgi:eukaryotic-like serine/threonine-protein kinase